MNKYPLLISTDIGTDPDDAIAVYLSTRRPEIELKGVWVTNGDVRTRARIARKLLNYSGNRVRVLLGEAEPISGLEPYMHGYEKGFLTPREVYRSQKWDIEEYGLAAVEKMLDAESEIYVLSIAPMTNIAKLLRRKPNAPGKIKRIYIMGTRLGADEHNVHHDVRAAQEVFNSDLNLTIVPANICDRYGLDYAHLMYGNQRTRAVEFISNMASAWRIYRTSIEFAKIPQMLYKARMQVGKRIDGDKFIDLQNAIEHLRTTRQPEDLEKLWSHSLLLRGIVNTNPEFRDIEEYMDAQTPKELNVHDAYTIFCMLYPDSIRTTNVSIAVDNNGLVDVSSGGRHEFVMDLDYKRFMEFLYEGLGIKTRDYSAKRLQT